MALSDNVSVGAHHSLEAVAEVLRYWCLACEPGPPEIRAVTATGTSVSPTLESGRGRPTRPALPVVAPVRRLLFPLTQVRC